MKISLICAVYKNIEALKLIVEALKYQTYKNFELVVVEDCMESAMRDYIASITDIEVVHTSQEDIGLRKARSQNNGILASTGEYLVFIDGDCIPYSNFIEGHAKLAQQGYLLSGRRVNLNEKVTNQLLSKEKTPLEIEKSYTTNFSLMFDKTTKYEQGLYFDPDGFIYKNLINKKNRNVSILGCNFSVYKKDFFAINGFDEGYGGTALSDDTDLDWRFQAYGLKIKSCKNIANIFHMWHKVVDRGNPSKEITLMEKNKMENKFVCEKGLNTH